MDERNRIKSVEKLKDETMVPLDAFREEQRFGQWWLWLLVGLSAAAVIIPFAIQLLTGTPIGSKPAPTYILGLFSAFMIGLVYLFSTLKLKTYIDKHQIVMKYGILGSKTIPWSDVEKADIVDYGFVGYGKRISRKHGWVYNVAGKWGLFLTLKNGKKFTIGTQQKE